MLRLSTCSDNSRPRLLIEYFCMIYICHVFLRGKLIIEQHFGWHTQKQKQQLWFLLTHSISHSLFFTLSIFFFSSESQLFFSLAISFLWSSCLRASHWAISSNRLRVLGKQILVLSNPKKLTSHSKQSCSGHTRAYTHTHFF